MIVRALRVMPLALAASIALTSSEAEAQRRRPPGTTGDGFYFEPPKVQLTVMTGLASVGAGSDLWDFSMDELTLRKRDFNSLGYAVDLAVTTSSNIDVVFGFSGSSRRAYSEFRDWVDNNDQPIEQSTLIERNPLSASARYHFAPRGRQIGRYAWIPTEFVPWVGIGGGMMHYRFQQDGDWVDYQTSEIFTDRFESRGWAPFAQFSLGGALSLGTQLQLSGEFRYLRGSAELGSDFSGFDRLDLSGAYTMLGLSVRF